MPTAREHRLPWRQGVPLLAIVAACAHAWHLRWVSDDAFISFRYAQHLVQGHGLVYNAGERVEGYTNFLWTLLSALPLAAGLDPVVPMAVLGIAAFGGTLGVLAAASRRIAHDHAAPPWLPLATLALAAHLHARVFATSGLETALFTLLVTATVALVPSATRPGHAVFIGVIGALACATRPEGALYLLLAGVALPPRLWPALAGPALGLLLPYAGWKLWYYGDLLPNTWHAKAGPGPRWQPGLAYLGLYFQTYWPLFMGIPAALWLALRPRGPGWASRRTGLLLLACTVLPLVYVARVGGDFMYARFCLPFTPLLLLSLETALARLPRLAATGLALGVPVVILAMPPPAGLDARGPDGAGIGGVVEERSWYPESALVLARQEGAVLQRVFDDVPVRIAIFGTQAMLAYYSEAPYVLEAVGGLTDRELARRSADSTRVGHDKGVDTAYLRSRGVDLTLSFRGNPPRETLTAVQLGFTAPDGQPVTGTMVSYRSEVVAALVDNGAEIMRVEPLIDQAIRRLPMQPPASTAEDYALLKGYYFDHNDDPARQQPFRAKLGLPEP